MALICGTMLARNEEWIIGLSARAALLWLDHLIILDHASEDKTWRICCEIAKENPSQVTLLHETDQTWHEMLFRQRMLDTARRLLATHIVVVDADEILTGNLLKEIRPAIENLNPLESLEPPWIGIRGNWQRYHTNGVWGTNWVSTAFLDDGKWFWRARSGYDFHHRRPMGEAMHSARPWKQGEGGIMHLQFLSDRRLRAKQAAYKMQEVIRWPGREPVSVVDKRYNPAVYGTPGDTFASAPIEWWKPYLQWGDLMDPDAEPWQEKQCQAWMKQYGPQKFTGLDLFGVV